MSDIFEKFTKKAPVAVMARAALEFALEPTALDALFAEHADRQYEKKLLFSTMLDVAALVVCRVQPTVRAAYQAMREQVPVSLTALYDKLGGVEMATTEALVAHSAIRLGPVIAALGTAEAWLPGYRIRVLDGNHLAIEHATPFATQIESMADIRREIVLHQPFLDQMRLRQRAPQLFRRIRNVALDDDGERLRCGLRHWSILFNRSSRASSLRCQKPVIWLVQSISGAKAPSCAQ